ncbi:hypothetical protein [Alloprevotella tannerae]|uniref:hypothetical protein n=1 Tax=Alloprevotella tannerae TaxID=76122 RepID=UPI0028EABE51|nr:hypothetical protein [Alloprevotella tannerae]
MCELELRTGLLMTLATRGEARTEKPHYKKTLEPIVRTHLGTPHQMTFTVEEAEETEEG